MKSIFSIFSKQFLRKDYKRIRQLFLVDGNPVSDVEGCQAVGSKLKMERMRKHSRDLWKELMVNKSQSSVPSEIEYTVSNSQGNIKSALSWYDDVARKFFGLIQDCWGIVFELLGIQDDWTDEQWLKALLKKLPNVLDTVALFYAALARVCSVNRALNTNIDYLQSFVDERNGMASNMADALKEKNAKGYRSAYGQIANLNGKKHDCDLRKQLLDKLRPYAPDLADKIARREKGFNTPDAPADIAKAWEWKRLSCILEAAHQESLGELYSRAAEQSKCFRRATAKLVEEKAWYELISALGNRKDGKAVLAALNSLPGMLKHKGRQKSSSADSQQIREALKLCQSAVPAWIMPLNKAIYMLDAAVNKFDVVIIDEASQADISALVVAVMAEKLIVVGDDKQVSPMAIGVQDEELKRLVNKHLRGGTPVHNPSQYEKRGLSLYDLASSAPFSRVMLKEHFRSVPAIIDYNNYYFYDSQIKPLRSSSSTLVSPPLVSYQVDGVFENGRNECEALTICALLKACLEQDEYAGKTFGVMSLLSSASEHVAFMQDLINRHIEPRYVEERRIICGIPSHFQGDERDVVFLSMVHSAQDGEVLPLIQNNENIRKRYNVAVSRAKDQLWLVHSAGEGNLKPDDLRYNLLRYIKDPSALEIKREQIKQMSDSPFEKAVAEELHRRNYRFVQQYEVGSYRIDIVVIYGDRRIALECDGDRYHSGDQKVKEDMNRQFVLERLGWRFIRIRGSQWFKDPEGTMESLCRKLAALDIYPSTDGDATVKETTGGGLKERVISSALRYLDEWRKNAPATIVPTSAYRMLASMSEQIDGECAAKAESGHSVVMDGPRTTTKPAAPKPDKGARAPQSAPVQLPLFEFAGLSSSPVGSADTRTQTKVMMPEAENGASCFSTLDDCLEEEFIASGL